MPTKKATKKLNKILTVKVNAKCIINGKVGNYAYCPVALALKSLGFNTVSVGVTIAHAKRGRNKFQIELPKKAGNFIQKFDNSVKVKPFSFRIRPESVKEWNGSFLTSVCVNESTPEMEWFHVGDCR